MIAYLDLVNEITAPLAAMPVVSLGAPPLAPLGVPLESARVMLVNSAGIHLRSDPPFGFVDDLSYRLLDQSLGQSAMRPCHPSPIRRPGRLDLNVVYPYERLAELAASNAIAGPTEVHLSMLGAVKKITALVTDLGPAMASEAVTAGADVVMLVPLCPACHQTIGILARVIEAAGVPTVTVTGARDITERVRPPRAAYLDYPLGYSLGRPFEHEEQRSIVLDVLRLVGEEAAPGEIVDLDYRWPDDGWETAVRKTYWDDRETVIGQRGAEFAPDGTHLAAAEVAAVESLLGGAPLLAGEASG
ncbi:MAG: hypothetical protein ACRDZP_06595 [Acidimicrobiales bacterium]